MAELNDQERTARELRHTFASVLSIHEMSTEEVSLLFGHNSTGTTERVYRQLPPVRRSAARAMDKILHHLRRYPTGPASLPPTCPT